MTITGEFEENCKVKDPIWTPVEVEKFWQVIEPYLTNLLNGALNLPGSNIDFKNLDPQSENNLRQCLHFVHQQLWQGKYTQSVANLKAVRKFFSELYAKESQKDEHCKRCPYNEGDLEHIRRIFFSQPVKRHVCKDCWT
ncbi:predicted protein [Nematostella vectensis]|uniref:Uncharacterized protein n=1 Tax=Nematostella vectensis TaxID=45351 RepID=A7SPP9_NEMVE|nr:predicted protein [Nematostella vectensis]|eukprot:XP_001626391.1 predicted protein [Nematostella vectensis]